MRIRKLFFFLGALLAVLTTQESKAALKFKRASHLENLTNSSILYAHQDSRGYIWLGSYDGLNRYDGRNVKAFRFELNNPDGLSGNIIENIFSAGDDYLWILTTMGLDKLDLNTNKFTEHYGDIRGNRSRMTTNEVGNAWVLHPSGLLQHYNSEKHRFENVRAKGVPANDNVLNMIIDDTGNLWFFLPERRVVKLNTSEGVAEPVAESINIFDKPLSVAVDDGQDAYVVDTDNRLFRVVLPTGTVEYVCDMTDALVHGRISDIARLGDDYIVAFSGAATGVLDHTRNYRFVTFQNDVGVFQVFHDKRQQLVWCSTDGQGLAQIHEENVLFHTVRSSQIPGLSKPIRSFYASPDSSLWIGTKGSGLFRIANYRRHSVEGQIPASAIKRYGLADGLTDDQVFAFFPSLYRPGQVWLGTRGPGLTWYNASTDKITVLTNGKNVSYIDQIHDIFEQNDTTLWLASTRWGLLKCRITSGGQPKIESVELFQFIKDKYICNEVYSMTFDGKHTLYVGCRGGLGIVRFNILTNTYDFIENVTECSPNIGDVISIYYEKGKLYFGASSGGGIVNLNKTDANGNPEVKLLTRADGMDNDMVHSILPDKVGNVWMATNKGLVRYNPASDVVFNINSKDVREFCDNAGHRSALSSDMFFGALNGFTWFSAEGITNKSDFKPEFHFSLLRVNGRECELSDYACDNGKYEFSSSDNSLRISFNALDYIAGDDISYSYMLEGLDDQWVSDGGENTASFSNLPPGDYCLRVRYWNNPWETNYQEKTLDFTIRPPWYRTKAAYVGYGVEFILLMMLVAYELRRRYHRRRDEMVRTLNERNREQLDNDRVEFFTNITHELCSPLTMIMGLSNILEEKYGIIDKKEYKKYLDSLATHSGHLNELIQEILEFRKMEEGGYKKLSIQPVRLGNLFERRVQPYESIAAENDIVFTVDIENPDLRWNTDTSCISKILSNLTTNALKYTPVGGRIDIRCREIDDRLEITVYNTGSGLSQEECQKLFNRYTTFENIDRNGYRDMASRHGLGLYITHSLVERLGGTISVESEQGQYVRFTVILPHIPVEGADTCSSETETEGLTLEDTDKPDILVVDDNKDILWLLTNVLSDKYVVRAAISVEKAMQEIERKVPSLIITDIMMPDIDGIAFIKTLRSEKYTRHLPIVILSAKIADSDKIVGLDAGADAYVVKPFSNKFITTLVDRLLARKQTEQSYYNSSESNITLHEGAEVSREDKEFMERVRKVILDKMAHEDKFGANELAAELGMDVRTLYRRFKASSNYTPNDYIRYCRCAYAARLLLTTNLTVLEIIYRTGVNNRTAFNADFKKFYNMTPSEYRKTHFKAE